MAAGGTTQGPSFPGRGEWATLQGWGAEGEQFGMGQRAPRTGGDPRRRRGASGDSREVPRRAPPPRFPLPAAAPAGLRPTSTPPAGPRPGAGSEAGRRAAGALPPPPGGAQLLSGPAGLGVTCALPPVPGDHGLAGDGVQPGGALRLLAAGGGEKKPRRGVSGDAVRSRGGRSGTDPPRCPAVASFPPPSGPPAPAPVLYLMKKTRPPLVIP